jgi:hypothetical protein
MITCRNVSIPLSTHAAASTAAEQTHREEDVKSVPHIEMAAPGKAEWLECAENATCGASFGATLTCAYIRATKDTSPVTITYYAHYHIILNYIHVPDKTMCTPQPYNTATALLAGTRCCVTSLDSIIMNAIRTLEPIGAHGVVRRRNYVSSKVRDPARTSSSRIRFLSFRVSSSSASFSF